MLIALLVVYIAVGAIAAAALIAAAVTSGIVGKSATYGGVGEITDEWRHFADEDSQRFAAMMTPRMANHDVNCKEVKVAFVGSAEAMYQEMRVGKEKQLEVLIGIVDNAAT